MDERASDKPIRAGTFDTVPQAEGAVHSLLAAGFTRDQLAVLCSDKSKQQFFDDMATPEVSVPPTGTSMTAGGAVGAAIGGAALAATALATAGVGLVAAGTILVGGGALAGGFTGAMLGGGELTDYYDQAVRRGRILVAVEVKGEHPAQRLAQAEHILIAAGTDPVALAAG